MGASSIFGLRFIGYGPSLGCGSHAWGSRNLAFHATKAVAQAASGCKNAPGTSLYRNYMCHDSMKLLWLRELAKNNYGEATSASRSAAITVSKFKPGQIFSYNP